MDSDCLGVDRGGSLHPVAGSHQGEIVSLRKTAYCDHLRRGDSQTGCLPLFFCTFLQNQEPVGVFGTFCHFPLDLNPGSCVKIPA